MDRAIELTPTSAEAHDNRGWFRATCPDGKYRNGKQAVASATRACELTAWNNPVFLDTLGAACAEHRDFTAAVEWQEKALALLGASQHPIQKEIESRLTLFQAKQPYHERTNAPRTNDPSAQPAPPLIQRPLVPRSPLDPLTPRHRSISPPGGSAAGGISVRFSSTVPGDCESKLTRASKTIGTAQKIAIIGVA